MRLLALNYKRFPGDLEALEEAGVEIIRFPYAWQHRIPRLIRRTPADRLAYMKGDLVYARQINRTNAVMRPVLNGLCQTLHIDGMITATINYYQDIDYTRNSPVPVIALHKECAFAESERLIEWYMGTLQGYSWPHHMIVHGEAARQAFVDHGIVHPDKIAALGCLRMDRFLNDIMPQITLFSFPPNVLIRNEDMRQFSDDPSNPKLFESVHKLFIETAVQHPTIRFVIKPKWGAQWYDAIRVVGLKHGLDVENIPNLSIEPGADPHELIRKSITVVAFQSTTILESYAAGVRVIVPHYCEAQDLEDLVVYRSLYPRLDVARDDEELARTLVPREALAASDRLPPFYEYLSRPNAARRYVEYLRRVCNA